MGKARQKAGICGHFGGGTVCSDGQTVKTLILSDQLKALWGGEEVRTLDTYRWKEHPVRLLFGSLRLLRRCENVLLLPSRNGVKVFLPLFLFWNHFYHRRIHYILIGGWLPEMLRERPRLLKKVRRLDGVFAETLSLTEELQGMGIRQARFLPNCKKLMITERPDAYDAACPPLRLCTFSRVVKGKGIAEAADAVRGANERLGRQAFSLDIWGAVSADYEEEFEHLKQDFPPYIRYRGVLPYGDTTPVLETYFAMLFPTRYPREGVPGSVLDAYAAGLPVLASRFFTAPQVIEDGKTGLLLDFDDITEALTEALCACAGQPEMLLAMRRACAARAEDYQAEHVIGGLAEILEQKEGTR